MQALVSLLPRPVEDEVFALWDELEARFGLKYTRVAPFPHFTWQLGESYDKSELVPLLNDMTQKLSPLRITAHGIKTFTNDAPVVYVPIEKDTGLVRLHTRLWKDMQGIVFKPDKLYSPTVWQPHITLALQDVGREKLDAVLAYLQPKLISWQFNVDNFALFCQPPGGVARIEFRFQFGQGLIDFEACA